MKHLHEFYGELQGVRIARKHLGWYSAAQEHATEFRARVNKTESAQEQVAITEDYFAGLNAQTHQPALISGGVKSMLASPPDKGDWGLNQARIHRHRHSQCT